MKRLLSMILALLFLCACTGVSDSRPCESTIFAMDTVMDLTVYGTQQVLDSAVAEINRLEKLLSVTRQDSEVYTLNHSSGQKTPIGADTSCLLSFAQTLGKRTEGSLDITLYPLVRAWGFTTGTYQIPAPEHIAALLEQVDCQAIVLEGNTATLPAGAEIDFGALAKGYAGERCAQILKEAGVTSAILRLGGNIQTVGSKPDGSAWTIALQDPGGDEGQYLGTIKLTDQAAVTSGGYQRYFEEDGVCYWHILDPHTGAPARSGLTSVTVVGDSGTLCDGLSTALFVLGREQALELWRHCDDFEAILVDEEDTVWVTGGLAGSFSLEENTNYTVQIVEE